MSRQLVLTFLIIFLSAVIVNCFQSDEDKRLNPNDLLVDDTIQTNDNIKSFRFDNGNYAVFLHNVYENNPRAMVLVEKTKNIFYYLYDSEGNKIINKKLILNTDENTDDISIIDVSEIDNYKFYAIFTTSKNNQGYVIYQQKFDINGDKLDDLKKISDLEGESPYSEGKIKKDDGNKIWIITENYSLDPSFNKKRYSLQFDSNGDIYGSFEPHDYLFEGKTEDPYKITNIRLKAIDDNKFVVVIFNNYEATFRFYSENGLVDHTIRYERPKKYLHTYRPVVYHYAHIMDIRMDKYQINKNGFSSEDGLIAFISIRYSPIKYIYNPRRVSPDTHKTGSVQVARVLFKNYYLEKFAYESKYYDGNKYGLEGTDRSSRDVKENLSWYRDFEKFLFEDTLREDIHNIVIPEQEYKDYNWITFSDIIYYKDNCYWIIWPQGYYNCDLNYNIIYATGPEEKNRKVVESGPMRRSIIMNFHKDIKANIYDQYKNIDGKTYATMYNDEQPYITRYDVSDVGNPIKILTPTEGSVPDTSLISTLSPTPGPTKEPTPGPTLIPTKLPTVAPSKGITLRTTIVPTPCPTPNPTFGKTNKPTSFRSSTNKPTIKNSIIETSSPTGKPSPCSTDNLVGIPDKDSSFDDDTDREKSDDTTEKESDNSNNEDTDNGQIHIIVIAILCIVIVALIIYFHITKQFSCYWNSKKEVEYGCIITGKSIDETKEKINNSKPSAPPIDNKI